MDSRQDGAQGSCKATHPEEDRPLKPGGSGTLYVVGTPIGNLEDVTLRALRVLREVDRIAAEKVGHTRGFCRHHGIRTPVTGYRRENERPKAAELIRLLRNGRDAALVTDAGTPGLSDPGAYLIDQAARAGITVSPIPGPSAVAAALSVAGLPAEEFLFGGFLPARRAKRTRALKALAAEQRTLVFFEAPHRMAEALADLESAFGGVRWSFFGR